LLCAVDVETTGLEFEKHDIYELAIIPLDQNYERSKSRPWLSMLIQPVRYDTIGIGLQPKRFNREGIEKAKEKGYTSDSAREVLQRWFDLQKLGNCKIAPIGSNYSFDSRFLRMWLGDLNYESMIADYEARDTMKVAKFLNDVADWRDEMFPYKKASLSYLSNVLNVQTDYGREHTALADAAKTADVYKRLMEALNKKMLAPGATNY